MPEPGRSRPSWILVAVVVAAIAAIVVVKQTAKSRAESAPGPGARQGTVESATRPSQQASAEEPQALAPAATAVEKPAPPPGRASGPAAKAPAAPARQAPASATAPPTAPAVKPEPSPVQKTAPAPAPEPEKQAEPLTGSEFESSLKSGRPTMADFGAGWCRPCKMMEPVLKEAAGKYEGKVNIVFVDTDDYGPLARGHRVAAIPTQIFFDTKGKEVGRHVGYYPIEELDAQMRSLELIK